MFREIQTTGRQNIEMALVGRSKLMLANQEYKVSPNGLVEKLSNGDVRIDVVDFDDPDLAKDIDAAFIDIKPHKSTPIQGWFGDRVFIETVNAGSGTWIGVSPSGQIVQYEFDCTRSDQGLICYGAGWIGSWVAGRHGLEILEVCVPRFTVDTWTREAKLGDERVGDTIIPLAFQALYVSLMGLDRK